MSPSLKNIVSTAKSGLDAFDALSNALKPNINTATIDNIAQVALDYLKSGLPDIPDALKYAEVRNVLNALRVKRGTDLPNDVFKEYLEHNQPVKVLEHYVSLANNLFKDEKETSKLHLDNFNSLVFEKPQDLIDKEEQYKAFEESIREEKTKAFREYQNIRKELYESGVNWSETDNAPEAIEKRKIYDDFLDKSSKVYREYTDLHNQKVAEFNAKKDALKQPIINIGEKIKEHLLAKSSISKEQADSWAKSQVIDSGAIKRLSNNGYKKEDLLNDMAEFYRLTGGKLREISIKNNGAKRANARGIGEIIGSEIYIDSDFDKRILFHELAHHLESDQCAKIAANGFLEKRRTSEKVYRLRSLTGNNGYSRDEVAYDDDFINPYVGKVYNDGVTEVFSMGIECFSDPFKLAELVAKDPEMFNLMIGYIQSPLTPAMEAVNNLYSSKADEIKTEKDSIENEFNSYIKKLAETVTLTKETLSEKESEYINFIKVNYIGSFNGWHICSGLVSDVNSRRKKSGFFVFSRDESGYIDYSRMPDKDIVKLKALLAYCDKNSQIDNLLRIFYRFFMLNKKQEFINTAKQILGQPQ